MVTLLKSLQSKDVKSWAHDEETALEKILELASFYLKLPKDKFKLDKARKEENTIITN